MVSDKKIYIEADTGEEIIEFIRRMRKCIVVRDAITKRFIKWLHGMTIEVSVVFDYPKGKQGNPLYVDVKTSTFRPVDLDLKVEKVEMRLAEKAVDLINMNFSGECAARAKVAGVEHKAEPIKEIYPAYHYWIIWHHYKDDEREMEGSDYL